ncbi:hypothetical protein EDB87DRAFT_1684954 [Lactarius vividus]|nr:hypothetical protein EDB87DRAFT_1684954 [Lactarius vividus]
MFTVSLRSGQVTESPPLLAEGQTSGPGVAASLSGGGFSNYFACPSYRDQAVSTFLQGLGRRYQGALTGRGIPDVVAHAINF